MKEYVLGLTRIHCRHYEPAGRRCQLSLPRLAALRA